MELKINLLPGEYRHKKLKSNKQKSVTLVSIVVVVYLLVSTLFLLMVGKQLNAELTATENYLAKQKEISSKLDKVEKLERKKMKSRDAGNHLYLNSYSWVDYLLNFEKLIPPGIVLQNISGTTDGKIYLHGESQDLAGIMVMLDSLKRSEGFEIVVLQFAQLKDNDSAELMEFAIMCTVKRSAGQ